MYICRVRATHAQSLWPVSPICVRVCVCTYVRACTESVDHESLDACVCVCVCVFMYVCAIHVRRVCVAHAPRSYSVKVYVWLCVCVCVRVYICRLRKELAPNWWLVSFIHTYIYTYICTCMCMYK